MGYGKDNSPKTPKTAILVMVAVFLAAFLGGCQSETPQPSGNTSFTPVFYANEFSDTKDWSNGITADTNTASAGYIGISISAKGKYKVQIVLDSNKYNYDIPSDGTVTYFPFSLGNGTYKVRVLKNTSGNKYVELTSRQVKVKLSDEFQPFLHTNVIINYQADSKCVKKASQLAAKSADESAFMTKVFDYICSTLSYDSQLAASVESGYVPDPDTVMSKGKGICYDYASLAAAMLRSQGIPCKLITGYLNDYYHAWNAIYLKDEGWVVTEINVEAAVWSRVDFTLADNSRIGNGSTVYTDAYVY